VTDFAMWSLGVTHEVGHKQRTRSRFRFSRAHHSKTEWMRGVHSMEQRRLELGEGLGRGLALRDPQHVESHGFR